MFKKLVVGALATGIALTGGIGAASADTQKAVSSPKQATCSIPYEYSNGKFKRTLYYSNGVYANSFNENVCGDDYVVLKTCSKWSCFLRR